MPIIQTKKELRPRDKWDFYPTPTGLVRAAANYLVRYTSPNHLRTILDPGSGKGVWGREFKKVFHKSIIYGCDQNFDKKPEGYDFWRNENFLEADYTEQFDIIVGNPPYRDIESFLNKSWTHLKPKGFMFILARLALICGQKRAKTFWPKLHPIEIIPLPMRPSFTGNGKTDATEYMLALWQKETTSPTRIVWGFEYLRDKDLNDTKNSLLSTPKYIPKGLAPEEVKEEIKEEEYYYD